MTDSGATIFVVDDDASVRRSLARLLRAAGWNVEAFASTSEFLERPSYPGIGCLVVDVSMPGMTGPELHDRMADRGFSLPVIFLTGHGDVRTGVRAMKQGAVDFLLKPVDDKVLLQAIRQAVGRHAGEREKAAQQGEIQERIARLSPRELEVMRHVIQGKINKRIASDLGIAEKTVKAHRGEVMEKMAAGSVAELVRLCEAAGIR
jgi:FixJ family two-component response regulator